MTGPFADRAEAGHALAAKLLALGLRPPVRVLALPRGGVPVAAEVALALGAPLDLLLVRKVGAPPRPALAVAAVADGGAMEIVIDEATRALTGVDLDDISRRAQEALREVERRRRAYLSGRALLALQGATVVVVDDGAATGTTLRAALKALRRRQPACVVLALPLAPPATLTALRREADDVVCLRQARPFHTIGMHYADYHHVCDDEVRAALAAADRAQPAAAAPR